MHLPPLKGILPEHPSRTYPAVGRCIYCGSTAVLQDEHIIPLGLGGRFVLPKASCSTCSGKTSTFEGTCQRTMYGPLRLLYGLPSRRKKERPEFLQLKVKRSADSDWEYVPVHQSRFPFLLTFPYLGMPGALTGDADSGKGAVTSRLWIRGASPSHNFHSLLQELVADLRVHSIMPESRADVDAFCRLLAKIAFSFAVAERGGKQIDSPVIRYAIGEDVTDCLRYIGSRDTDEPAAGALHDLNMVLDPEGRLLVVRIRLLARLGTPTYYVVVQDTDARANTTQQAQSPQAGLAPERQRR